MGYSFRLRETIPDNVRRIAIEQIDKALLCATTQQPTLEICIHEIRKCLKKLRALVRLARPQIGKCYERENADFRTTANLLSTTRDTSVLHTTLHALATHYGKALPPKEITTIKNFLQQRVVADFPNVQASLAEVVLRLENARYRVAQWPLHTGGVAAIAAGATQVYKKGKEVFAITHAHYTPENVHEVRKHIKYLWYHTRLLTPLWPELFKEHSSTLSTLADTLGEHNDLAVLRNTLHMALPQSGSTAITENLALQRQHELWNNAVPWCMRIYAEPPKGYEQKLQAYWNAWVWQSQAKVLPTE